MENFFNTPEYLQNINILMEENEKAKQLDQEINNEIDFITKKKKDKSFDFLDIKNDFNDYMPKVDDEKMELAAVEKLSKNPNLQESSGLDDDTFSFLGEKGTGVVGSSLDMLGTVTRIASTRTKNGAEAANNMIGATLGGAKLGQQVGGGYGALIGAGAGLIYSGIDSVVDMNKNDKDLRQNNKEVWEEKKASREQDWLIEKGQLANESLNRLKKERNNFIV